MCEKDNRLRTVAIATRNPGFLAPKITAPAYAAAGEGGRRAVRVAPPCEQPAREVSAAQPSLDTPHPRETPGLCDTVREDCGVSKRTLQVISCAYLVFNLLC